MRIIKELERKYSNTKYAKELAKLITIIIDNKQNNAELISNSIAVGIDNSLSNDKMGILNTIFNNISSIRL